MKIKKNEQFQQKAVLAQEMHKVWEYLMFDLTEARESTILDVPADGLWHNRIAFDRARQGILEYIVKDGSFLRINNGKTLLIADHIDALRACRQKDVPDILEVEIEAKNNVSLISNLRIRMRQ